MGETKLQKIIFTTMICFSMVLGMTVYNMLLHEGWSGQFIPNLLKNFWLGFFIALLLDFYIVGPIGKNIAYKIVRPAEDTKRFKIVIAVSLCMVTGMVLCMSVFGSIMAFGFSYKALEVYPSVVLRNALMAMPLIAVVNPLVRFLFIKIFPVQAVCA